MREANRSLSGLKSRPCKAFRRTLLSSFHSDSLWFRLDSKSAIRLCLPGIWATLSQMSLIMHYSQISFAIELQESEWLVRMLFMMLTAVVVSHITLMCVWALSLAKVCNPKYTANISR